MKIIVNRLLNNKYCFFTGLASFIIYSISFLIGYDDQTAMHVLMPLKLLMVLVSAFLYALSCNNKCSDNIKLSYSVLSLVILIYEITLLIAVGKTIIYIRDYPAIGNSFFWIICSTFSLIRYRHSLTTWINNFRRNRNTVTLIISSALTSIIVILLSCEPEGVRFTWDSDTLYGFIYELDFDALYDAKLLTFHSHVVTVYAYILVLLKLLFNNIRTAYFILNSLCIIAASFGMTFLIKTLIPDRNPIDYILSNAVFMFSPWICGLSTYHMYDYYIWCLFPLLAYYMAKKNWIGFFAIGIMISFSKTTGIVVFGGACVGVLISEFIQQKKSVDNKKRKNVIVNLVKSIKYWYFLAAAFIFYLFFRLGIAESTQFEDTSFDINIRHILHQLKLYSTANFMWIYVIFTIILILYVFFTRHINISDDSYYVLLSLIIADIVFVCFNLVCVTYRLPRYMDSHIAFVYICALVLMLCLGRKILQRAVCFALVILGLISSFYMVDPVSLLLFNTINVGNRTIVDFEMTDSPSFEDSIAYNREYYSYEILLDKVLTYVINDMDEADDIMFSLANQPITWGFSGGRYSYGYHDGKDYFELFYDKNIHGLANGYSYDYYDSPDMIPFKIRYVFSEENSASVIANNNSQHSYYIYMPTLNQNREAEILDKLNIIDEKSFEFRGWTMNCIKCSN